MYAFFRLLTGGREVKTQLLIRLVYNWIIVIYSKQVPNDVRPLACLLQTSISVVYYDKNLY